MRPFVTRPGASLVEVEHDENELRKQFTAMERTAIGLAIEEENGRRQGQRTHKSGELVAKWPQVEAGQKTREFAAKKSGFSSEQTYRRAKSVLKNGSADLQKAVDEGKVSTDVNDGSAGPARGWCPKSVVLGI